MREVFEGKKKVFPGRFIMGEILHAQRPVNGVPATTYFNHLERLEVGWALDSVVFDTKDNKLKAMETFWNNGQSQPDGNMAEAGLTKWTLAVAPKLLLNSKITTVPVPNTNPAIAKLQSVSS